MCLVESFIIQARDDARWARAPGNARLLASYTGTSFDSEAKLAQLGLLSSVSAKVKVVGRDLSFIHDVMACIKARDSI